MSQRHGIDIVPSQAIVSPHGVDAQPGEDVPWWTPTWSEVASHLGWRWILFLPAALLFVAICLSPLRPGYINLIFPLWKPLVIVVLLPTGAAVRSIKMIVRNRKDPFCIHCGYSLIGLPEGQRCPECGRTFSLAVIEEYRRDPHWFIRRWKLMHTSMPIVDVPFHAGPVRGNKSRDGT